MTDDCNLLENYKFYFSIEGAPCTQYMTEKVFHSAFSNGAIPVVFGAPFDDYKRLLPPNYFIHMESYKTVEGLGKALQAIADNRQELLKYHKWRPHFETTNEHGFYGTTPYYYCRVCEALNYNDGEASTYELLRLQSIFDTPLNCNLEKYKMFD